MQKIEACKVIRSPLKAVQEAVWKIEKWAQFWSPLKMAEVFYDDGMHQDFSLYLEWQGKEAEVRTIRFKDSKGDIFFFSPKAPPPTTVHQGAWQFSTEDMKTTKLTAIRWFQLPLLLNEKNDEYLKRLEKFSREFQIRLETILEKLGQLCEV